MTGHALSCRVSQDADDREWDDFLERTPEGSYRQSSCWGVVRDSIGWKPVRVVVSQDGRVVGGAQMEVRSVPLGARVGLVRRAPVLAEDRPDLVRLVLDELLAVSRSHGVQYLVVQPAPGHPAVSADLHRRGFRPGVLDVLGTQETASVRIDLGPDLDEMTASLTRRCRQSINAAVKGGVTVRRGTVEDLPTFNRLKVLHSARLGYARRSEGYYELLWNALAPRGHVALFLAERDGEALSAELVIAFGSTSHHRERLWSGEHGNLHPNELVEWEAVKWAKSAGYRYTDFGAIETCVAEAVLSGQREKVDPRYSASRFKLKFGGDVVVDPPYVDYVLNPALRLAYRSIPPGMARSSLVTGVVSRLKSTGS